MAERIQFDAPAGIVGLMAALNCLTDVMAGAGDVGQGGVWQDDDQKRLPSSIT